MGQLKNWTMVFLPVQKCDLTELHKIDNANELARYIIESGIVNDIIIVENCPFDADELNSWDDYALNEVFDGNEDEYKAGINTMNSFLGLENSDEFIKSHWAIEVRGKAKNFRNKLYSKH